MKALFESIEASAFFLGQIFKSNLPSLFSIETADDEKTLVCNDGSFLSCFELRGASIAVGATEFEDLMGVINRSLGPSFKSEGHKMQVVISVDPSSSKKDLARILEGSRRTCENLSLDLHDVLDSRIESVSKLVSSERIFIGIWTDSSVLFPTEKKKSSEKRSDIAKKLPRMTRSGQNLIAAIPEIRDRHNAVIENFLEDMQNSNFFIDHLSAHEALNIARSSLFYTETPENWKPSLPGDPIPKMMRDPLARELDIYDLQYPPLAWQMFPKDVERVGPHVKVGDRDFAPLAIEIPQQEITDFNRLFRKLHSMKIPFRMSFFIEGGGIRYVKTKGMIAPFLSWAPPYNKRISEAVKRMRDVAVTDPVVSVKVSMCTWAPTGKTDLLHSYASKLSSAVTSWGSCEVREISGDAVNLLINACPFLSNHSIANAAVGPFEEVIRSLPFMRPASPWISGGFFYRTDDGKMIPFQPGSSLQSTWNYLIFAPPGYGKSVQISTIALSSVLQPGMIRLPRIAYVDIGPSGQGFTNMVKEALPNDQKHFASHARLRMTRDYSINVFDTQLGCRFPTPEHKSFLVNFLTKVVTPPEYPQGYASMAQLVSKIIEEVYKKFADEKGGQPKPYSQGMCPEVDEVLSIYTFDTTKATWWEVVDFLFEKEIIHEASMAQRYAVPTLSDTPGPSRESALEDLYGKITVTTGESLNSAFGRLISDAVRDMPILSDVTQFDLGDVRIATIDIDEVAKQGSPAADHQTALMYMLARFSLTKNFRLSLDSLRDIPEKYRAYHKERIVQIHEDMKWVICDEFHRTMKSPQVQDDVLVDMREGRKFNIGVILASQSIDDFPDHLVEFSTGVFIHNSGSEKNSYRLQNLFGFNETSRQLLVEKALGPTKNGAPFLAYFKMKQKNFCQLLWSSISPIEKWATSTTAEDVEIRRALYSRLGNREARHLLAELYPSGSAKDEVERLRTKFASEGMKVDAIHYVIDKAYEAYEKKKSLV